MWVYKGWYLINVFLFFKRIFMYCLLLYGIIGYDIMFKNNLRGMILGSEVYLLFKCLGILIVDMIIN